MTLNASILGFALVSSAALCATQGAPESVVAAHEFFVTAEGDHAHLWVREGTKLRVVGHGVCKDCPLDDSHDHKSGDGHDHGRKR